MSLKTMCALAILTAIIVTIWGLPASMEFPIALTAISVYALCEYHNQKHRKDKK